MVLPNRPCRGMRDLFPQDKMMLDFLMEKMKTAAELFGYEPYDGPLLEEVDLYKAKSGEELINEQIYSFEDRGGRQVAIRPEMTPTLARMVSQVHQSYPRPLRWYAIPNLLRYERPQKGRLREHWQFNCDIFGASEEVALLEILQLIVFFLGQFGVNGDHFHILFNHRKVIDFVMSDLMKLEDQKIYQLYKLIDRYKKLKPNEWDEKVGEHNLSNDQKNIFENYLKIASFEDLFKFLEFHKADVTLVKFLHDFFHNLKELDLAPLIIFDPTIVRGLDYYTGGVFEVFDRHPDNSRAICGGGTYEKLLEIFGGPSFTAVGLGLGDVTLADFLRVHNLLPAKIPKRPGVVVGALDDNLCQDLMKKASLIRQQGVSVIFLPGTFKLSKLLSIAQKRDVLGVVFAGSTEKENQSVMVKNLMNGEQKVFFDQDWANLKSFLKL